MFYSSDNKLEDTFTNYHIPLNLKMKTKYLYFNTYELVYYVLVDK